MSNITIKGDGNKTSLVIDSSNASINAGGDTIRDYISDIQIYIRGVLSEALTNQILYNNNLAKTDKTFILDNIELCWVGEPESFYQDIKDKNFGTHAPNIFSHFMETSNTVTHHIRLQTNDGSFVTIPFSLTNDIFSKIQYVNSKVPDNLKASNPQGLHTLGLINNNICFHYPDINGPLTPVKDILNSQGFGQEQYYGLYAYTQTLSVYILTIKNTKILFDYPINTEIFIGKMYVDPSSIITQIVIIDASGHNIGSNCLISSDKYNNKYVNKYPCPDLSSNIGIEFNIYPLNNSIIDIVLSINDINKKINYIGEPNSPLQNPVFSFDILKYKYKYIQY